jgi:polysaccharide biosynthesis protein VpsJ
MIANLPHNPVSTVRDGTKSEVFDAIDRLVRWLEGQEYRGYDTFDGLNSRLLRPFTFETKLLRQVLQQGVRRFPLNLRPLFGIAKSPSTKGMGFIARGYIRLHKATQEPIWADRATSILHWLIENQSEGYSGACWGNHFDYQSRNSFVKAGVPSVVWTSLVGHAFLDGYEHFRDPAYLDIASSACMHLVRDLGQHHEGDSICISYFPTESLQVHNANTLAASLLGRTHGLTGNPEYRYRAEKAILYTARYQHEDGSWYYGEKNNLHWIDNFHTAYVLDSFKYYTDGTGDRQFQRAMMKGYEYWKHTFFLDDGTPRYYDHKTLPLDIQCCSQAIDTLVLFNALDPDSLTLASKVAKWTIRNMQDASGYFYYRRYSPRLVNKTPTLHWGQATMLCALSGLYKLL